MEEIHLFNYALFYKGYLVIPVQKFDWNHTLVGLTVQVYDPFGMEPSRPTHLPISSFEQAWEVGKNMVESDIALLLQDMEPGSSVQFALKNVGAIG